MTGSLQRIMIIDACVLIDFIRTDKSVLTLVANTIGRIHVPSPIVDEVMDLESEDELLELGLTIIEPELEDAFLAASTVDAISFQDKICLLTAKRHGFSCVTNDKNLRKCCEKEGVPIVWGLELLAKLQEVSPAKR